MILPFEPHNPLGAGVGEVKRDSIRIFLFLNLPMIKIGSEKFSKLAKI